MSCIICPLSFLFETYLNLHNVDINCIIITLFLKKLFLKNYPFNSFFICIILSWEVFEFILYHFFYILDI